MVSGDVSQSFELITTPRNGEVAAPELPSLASFPYRRSMLPASCACERTPKGISHVLKPPGKTSPKSQNCSTGLQTLSERGNGASDYDQKKRYLSSAKSGSCLSSRARREALHPKAIFGTLAVRQTLIWGACMQRLAQWLQAP